MNTEQMEALIDKIQELRNKKATVVDMYEKQISELSNQLAEAMNENGEAKLKGTLASASMSDTETVKVDDWDSVYQYINENPDAISIFQRRLAESDIIARRDAGERIPGIKISPVKKLTITKKREAKK